MHLDVEIAAQLEPAEQLDHGDVAEHDRGVALLTGEHPRFQVAGQAFAVGQVETDRFLRSAERSAGQQGRQDHPAGLRIAGRVVRDHRPEFGVVEPADLGGGQVVAAARCR